MIEKEWRKRAQIELLPDIIKFDNWFGENEHQRYENSLIGNMNGIIELFILSKCNYVFLGRTSSYAMTSFFLSKNKKENYYIM